MGSSSNSKSNSNAYAPSVASSSSTVSYSKPAETSSSKSSNSFIQSAKKFLSDIGSPPTASYDCEHGRETEKAYMPSQAPRRT
jgi:hypothetical protein